MRAMHLTAAFGVLTLLLTAACGSDDGGGASPEPTPNPSATPAGEASFSAVTLETSMGDIELALNAEAAPLSVANFSRYVSEGAYDGTIFHRVIPGFMVQGGGYDEALAQRNTHGAIENEATNGLLNLRGTLAMARTSEPHSARNQFFINVADNAFLDHQDTSRDGYGYAVFGEVTAGLDVVDAIVAVPTGACGRQFDMDCPQTAVIITRASGR